MACADCFATTVHRQRQSLLSTLLWLRKVESRGEEASGFGEPVSQIVLCRVEPACVEIDCEAPICRSDRTKDLLLGRIKRKFRGANSQGVELLREVSQTAINWCADRVPIPKGQRLQFTSASIHALFLANNILSAKPHAEHGDGVPSVVAGDVQGNSELSLEALGKCFSGGLTAMQAGDIIFIHFLNEALQGVMARIRKFRGRQVPPEEGQWLAALVMSDDRDDRDDWGEREELYGALVACDLKSLVGTLLGTESDSSIGFTSNPKSLSRVLCAIYASPGGQLVCKKMALMVADSVSSAVPTQLNIESEFGSGLESLSETCLQLLEGDREFMGAVIVSLILLEILHAFPVGPVAQESSAVESNPLWFVFSSRQAHSDECLASVLAELTRKVMAVERDRESPSRARALRNLRVLLRKLISRPELNAPEWQLLVIRYLKHLLSAGSDVAMPRGTGVDIASLCCLVERIYLSYGKKGNRGEAEGDSNLAEVVRSSGELMEMPGFITSRLTQNIRERDSRGDGFMIPCNEYSLMDDWMNKLIVQGKLFSHPARPFWWSAGGERNDGEDGNSEQGGGIQPPSSPSPDASQSKIESPKKPKVKQKDKGAVEKGTKNKSASASKPSEQKVIMKSVPQAQNSKKPAKSRKQRGRKR